MSYSTKYRTVFKDILGNDYKIEFKFTNYTGSIIDIIPAPNTLTIEYPDTEIYEPVKGFGATIRLYSTTDRQLVDLYTIGYKNAYVLVTRNGSTYFEGYVEAELYNEPFDRESNYIVEVQCNNGMGLLSREKYLQSDGTQYYGTTNVFDVIVNCIEKIDITYTINIATDLTVNSYIPANDKSILQSLIINEGNYVDEDGIEMNCREVLEAILKPFNLSLFIINKEVWIVDYDYLANDTIDYKSFAWGATTCTNHSTNLVKDLNSITQLDSSFDIDAGVNQYIITKNRYVKNIIPEVDLNKEYTEKSDYDPSTDVWGSVYCDPDVDKYIEIWWTDKNESLGSYFINGTDAYTVGDTAFAGAKKEILYIDSGDDGKDESDRIDHTNDGREWNNHIFMNNSRDSVYVTHSENYPDSPYDPNNYIEYDEDIGFSYTSFGKTGIINSTETVLRLNYSSYLYSEGIYTINVDNELVVKNSLLTYKKFLYCFAVNTKIYFRAEDGTITHYLRLKNTGSTYLTPDQAEYEVVEYTGTIEYCPLFIYELEENNDLVDDNIVNKQIDNYIDIPLEFTDRKYLKVSFYNKIDLLQLNSSGNLYERFYYKETMPFLLSKGLYTTLVDKASGEELDLEDDELQYYLDNKYKTDEKEDELINYTMDNKYVTDLGGITLNSNYITNVSSTSINVDNLEDFKAENIINQYSNSSINLSMQVRDNSCGFMNIYELTTDPLWSSKKFVAEGITNNVVDDQVELKLKEKF